jgi:hypothetical protein
MDTDQTRIQRSLNEQKKKELEKLYGARFSNTPNGIPPEAEGEWLDYVTEFERQYAENGQTTVREFVGSPQLRPLAAVPPDELPSATEALMDLLFDNNIQLHFDREVSDAEVYRFVTEELFREKMDNIRIEQMMHTFVYDHFHPDDISRVRRDAEFLLNALFFRDRRMIWQMLSKKEVKDFAGKKIPPELFMLTLNEIYRKVESFTSHLMEVTSCDVNMPRAVVTVSLTWAGIAAATKKPVGASGTASVQFVQSPAGGWDVAGVRIPGWA